MKKILMFSKMLSVTLTILVVVGVVWNLLYPSGTDMPMAEEGSAGTEETADGSTEDTAAEETTDKDAGGCCGRKSVCGRDKNEQGHYAVGYPNAGNKTGSAAEKAG